MSASQLLSQLLDYVLEQDKDIDPRGFKLSNHKGFIKGKSDLQGLPGVDFDIKVEGDHTWLRIARLEAQSPPALPDDPLAEEGEQPHVQSLGAVTLVGPSDPCSRCFQVDIATVRCSNQTPVTPTCFDHSLQSFRNDRLPLNAWSRSRCAENAG